MTKKAKCRICNEPMPEGEEAFAYHGYSGPCPAQVTSDTKTVTNNPGLEFKSLKSELYREYTFLVPATSDKTYGVSVQEHKIRIDNPQALNVSKSGGHRIQAENGNGVYIPAGWVKLEWENKPTEEASIQF